MEGPRLERTEADPLSVRETVEMSPPEVNRSPPPLVTGRALFASLFLLSVALFIFPWCAGTGSSSR